MSGAANRFQTGGDRNAIVKGLSLQQTIVRCVEIITVNVKTGQRQTLARGFVGVFVAGGYVAHALAQWNRSRSTLQGRSHTFESSIRRAIFDEEFCVEQGCLDFT